MRRIATDRQRLLAGAETLPKPCFRMEIALALAPLALMAATAASPQERDEPGLPEPLVGYPMPPWMEPQLLQKASSTPTFEEEVLEIVNQERWNNGQLPPLKGNSLLDSSSETHSNNMASRDFFAHCDPDTGTLPGARITAAGYSWSSYGENIAAGYSTPQSVMNAWMGSTGHRNNILSTNFRELGVGHFLAGSDAANIRRDLNGDCAPDNFNNGPYYRYWTQNFGRRTNVYPIVINREAHTTTSRNVSLYLYGTGWAVDMRLRNETGAWTGWQSLSSNVNWQLSSTGGTKTVEVELRSGTMSVLSASDTIFYDGPTEEIFTDGFESGNVSSWSSTSP